MENKKYNCSQDFGGLTSVKSSDQNTNCFESSNKQHVLTTLAFPSSDSKVLDDTSIVSNYPQDKTIIDEVKIKRSKDSELNGSRITRQQLLNTRINVKKVSLREFCFPKRKFKCYIIIICIHKVLFLISFHNIYVLDHQK